MFVIIIYINMSKYISSVRCFCAKLAFKCFYTDL